MSAIDLQQADTAIACFLNNIPSLKEQIELLIPPGTTPEQAEAFRRAKAWAELCHAARRSQMSPQQYCEQLLALKEEQSERRRIY